MKHLAFTLALALAASLVARADLTPDQVKKGQDLYQSGCLCCHKKGLDPKQYSDAQWGKCLDKMMPKTNLSADDKKLLTEYFAAVRLGKAELPKASAAAKGEKKAKKSGAKK